MTLRITDQAFATDTGRQRSANEDSVFVRAPVFVIADGMGGAQAGEVASKTSAESFDRELPQGPPERVLKETIEGANRTIHKLARQDPSLAGMGTTTTAAILDERAEEVAIGHVGDSRAYRLRRGTLERLTRDHSLVEEMKRKGQLTEAQAEDHPQRSIITRALGPEPEVEVDVQTVPAQAGDVFLICSDGLTTMLDDEHIGRLLARATSMPNAVRALVDEANRAGGRDNISVVAFKVVDAAEPALDSAAATSEGATLIGTTAEDAGLTATEVRRRAAADAARNRRAEQDAAKPGKRRKRFRRVAALLALVVVIGAIVFGATYGLHHTWFLGTDDAGRVTLYRGVPYELPFGIKLYSEKYSAPVQTESLPGRRQDAVTGHSVRSHSDAVKLLEEIERGQGIAEPTDTSGTGAGG
jgi:serine/threonine protein phosphatase PrpC